MEQGARPRGPGLLGEHRVPAIFGGRACPQGAWDAGRKERERDFGPRFRGGARGTAAQPQTAGENPSPTVSSSAADAESQDPDSTNHLESEAPRDYFLKCK